MRRVVLWLAVLAAVLGTSLALRPAAAARLEVTAAPLQTWTQSVSPDVAPAPVDPEEPASTSSDPEEPAADAGSPPTAPATAPPPDEPASAPLPAPDVETPVEPPVEAPAESAADAAAEPAVEEPSAGG